MRPKRDLSWTGTKMMGIIKALKCCQNMYQVVVCPCPRAFFKWWPWIDLVHFYVRVKFVPGASVWVTAYRAMGALVFPSSYPQHSGERYRTNGPLLFCLFVLIDTLGVSQNSSNISLKEKFDHAGIFLEGALCQKDTLFFQKVPCNSEHGLFFNLKV